MTTKLFALDIGTRSVIGIILEEHNNHFHVADMLMKEHKERAMVDGQIHNVLHVAELIQEIKEQLEEKHGPLTKVSVAAAGRSLKTEQASIKANIKSRPIFTEEDIGRLELQAVQEAQQQLLKQQADAQTTHYYCVGYSVLYYRLDGQEIGSLLDQQGEIAEIEVIATFLPRVVVESLMAALKRAQLEMDALTLEPIAAINVLIPPTMRRLNIALVDIGAGTSDIAITDNGTIIAYSMVPTAGDEITEALSDYYLLDFPIAEKIKRQLQTEEEVLIQDILGFDQRIPKEEVLSHISIAVKSLAKAIGEEILRLNKQTAPKAVMLIGGGSLTPNLTTELCQVLDLPNNRVAIRGIDAITSLTKDATIPITPDLVTPIGIAIAAKKAPIQYMSVTVNEQVIRLFELKEMTVSDAFLAANVRAKQLYGKPGHGLSLTVNGQDIFIPGEHGQPATILLNGETASTKSPIQHGDVIQLVAGQDGQIATAQIQDIVDRAILKNITVNGVPYVIKPKILVNNTEQTLAYVLKDRDIVITEIPESIEEALSLTQQEHLLNQLQPYNITIDSKPIYMPIFSSSLYINGKPGKPTYPIQNGDIIMLTEKTVPTVQMVADHLNLLMEDRMVVTFQGEKVELVKTTKEFHSNRVALSLTSLLPNGSSIRTTAIATKGWIFQDVFRFSKWQLPTQMTGAFTILRNNEPSSFDAEIFGGDTLEIRFTN